MEKVVFSNLFNSVNKSKIIIQMEILVPTAAVSYPVEHVRPALESDALEDRQHGLAEVVEAGDAPLRALPVLTTDSAVGTLEYPATGVGVLHHLTWAGTFILSMSGMGNISLAEKNNRFKGKE